MTVMTSHFVQSDERTWGSLKDIIFFINKLAIFESPPNPTNPTKLEAQPIPYALHTNNTPIFLC